MGRIRSRTGSAPLTNGSGSGRPKNMRIRIRLRIRIRWRIRIPITDWYYNYRKTPIKRCYLVNKVHWWLYTASPAALNLKSWFSNLLQTVLVCALTCLCAELLSFLTFLFLFLLLSVLTCLRTDLLWTLDISVCRTVLNWRLLSFSQLGHVCLLLTC